MVDWFRNVAISKTIGNNWLLLKRRNICYGFCPHPQPLSNKLERGEDSPIFTRFFSLTIVHLSCFFYVTSKRVLRKHQEKYGKSTTIVKKKIK